MRRWVSDSIRRPGGRGRHDADRPLIRPATGDGEDLRGLYERVYLKTYDRLLPLNREIQKIVGYPPI